LKAKATATAKATKSKTKAYSRNCQTLGVTPAEPGDYLFDLQKLYDVQLDERKQLIDAARESSRTFDKAVLAFGSAIFGFSIAFLKDIAPRPVPATLGWLLGSWLLFSFGLLSILLSFLFSHRACMFEIDRGQEALNQYAKGEKEFKLRKNRWSIATDCCNVVCVVLLFFGLFSWSIFAYENLSQGDTQVNKVDVPIEKKGYVPPPAPKTPPQQQTPSRPASPPANQPGPKK
jgi:hypothetical protein